MIARIGPYEVLEELGMGGFGRVYRAYDPSMKREVAIKVLASEADSDLLSRFDAEANTTGTLQHTNIVTVFQYAKDQDIPYLVMELLEGQNLQQVLKLSREGRRPPLSLLEKVEIMAQVAEGLNFAHHRKIVHRDIKPANIMVLPNGRVKIMDFGIARLTGKDATRHTRKGDLIGSLHYMSPEQFKGLDSDTLSDIFAFGVLFYEVLTGVRPFEADDPGSIMWQITSTEPAAIRELLPNCPEVLDWIVQRALSKDRDMRYQSLADVLFDIAPVRQELRQAAAGEGLAKVRPLVEAGDLDAAKAILRSVLERDSSNQQAQALWKQVGEEQQRRAIRSKVSLLVNDARERLGKREHKEAIGLIEQALRLDKTDTSAQSLLQSAKQDYDAVRRSARSLADARREYQAGNLTSAHENVLAAVQADADNQEAAALLEVVAKTIEARDAERRRRELLRHVEALRVQALYRDALAVLDQLDAEQPQIPEAAVLRTRIAADMEEQQRRRRQQQLEAGARRARQLIDSGNYEGCIEFLSEFHGEFPDDEVLGELHAEAQERQAAQRRGNFIAERLAAIESSLSSGSLEDAHRLAQESLERYPRDPMLAAALARVVAAIAERERSALIAAQLAEIHQLQYRGELNAALEKAGTASRRFENDPELLALEGSLKEAVKRRDYAEDLRTMVDRVQDFLGQGRPEDAKRLLDDSADRFASEPELARLLSDTAHAQATKNEKVFVDKFMARLSGLEDAGQFSQAAEEVQRALTR
ncbi:MAG TPA: serine/threonine-protein kinase, partial [Bryobacteraceae bacterium]|nr:serine/threonine-protein kinase [Bryobacteraceae bacterium]